MTLKERILIVDDERDVCWALSRLLEKQGYIASGFLTGEGACEKIKEFSPDLILLDLRLPRVNGLEVLARIKKLDPDLPVIMLTAHGNIRSAVRAIKLGAFDYITNS